MWIFMFLLVYLTLLDLFVVQQVSLFLTQLQSGHEEVLC